MTTSDTAPWSQESFGARSYVPRKKLIRPAMTLEDPPETANVEVDWSYVAECAKRNPGRWLRVTVDSPGWYPTNGASSRSAPIRRNNIKTLTRGGSLYVRFDGRVE